MSGVVSSIGKAFTSVVSGVSTAIGSAVSGVGAVVGTAASAGASLFGGGTSSLLGSLTGGGGILSNLFNGVLNVTTKGLGGLVDTVGTAGSQLLGGGMAAGATAAGGAAPSFLSKAGDFLTSQTGAGLIGGIGKGLMEYEKMEQDSKERQKDRDYLYNKEMRIRDSYNVNPGSLPNGASGGPVDNTPRPTPATQYSRDFDYVYNPELGRIVKQGT